MKFDDILHKETTKYEVLLGHKNNKIFSVNLKEYPSIIITGETGSGKSILLDEILVQLINKLTSIELGIIAIDTSGVELNYYADSKYALFSAINDIPKSIVALSRVLREIERRNNILKEYEVKNIDEYNLLVDNKIPLLVVAIDDDKFFLRNPDVDKMIDGIISQIKDLNIVFVMVTSDVHNKFFESDKNMDASIRITFDYTNPDEAKKINIPKADELKLGKFMCVKDNKKQEYWAFEFDDNIIVKTINR